jgi:hypothetical protein
LRFYFFKLTQPLTVPTVHLLYTVKEKEGKPDRKPYPLPYGLRNPYRNSQGYAQKNLNEIVCPDIKPYPLSYGLRNPY